MQTLTRAAEFPARSGHQPKGDVLTLYTHRPRRLLGACRTLVVLTCLAAVCFGEGNAAAANEASQQATDLPLVVRDLEPVADTTLKIIKVSLGDDPTSARAFVTSSSATLDEGDELQIATLDDISTSTAQRNEAVELGKRYGDIAGKRILVASGAQAGDVDVPAELAAYQLALWSVLGNSQDLTIPNRILARTNYLLGLVGKWRYATSEVPIRPLRPEATVTPYLNGSRVTVALQGAEEALEGELVELRSGSDLLAIKAVDGNGKTHFDLPFGADYQGQISARWRGYLPAGTPLRTADGDATLVLAGALEYPALDSTPVDVTKPNAWQNTLSLALDRGMPVWLAALVGFFVALIAALGLGAIIDRIKTEHTGMTRGRLALASLAAALLAFGGLYVGAWNASRDFDARWTSSDDIAGPELPISDVSAAAPEATFTVHNNNNEPNNGFSPSCAVDGSPWSSWRSRRHTGPLLLLRLSWPTKASVSKLSLTPGYFNGGESAEQVYAITGQPTLIQVFDGRGAAVERKITRPAYVRAHSDREPKATTISLPGAWSGPLYIRIINIEQHKDTFAVAEIQLFGGTLPAGQSTSEEQILGLTEGPTCPS